MKHTVKQTCELLSYKNISDYLSTQLQTERVHSYMYVQSVDLCLW